MCGMRQNVYDYSYEMRKKRRDKIVFVLSVVVSVFLGISLILHFVLFSVSVKSDTMESDIVRNGSLFVSPLFRNPKRGDVFYISRMDGEKTSVPRGMVNVLSRFLTAQKFYPFGWSQRMSAHPVIRRVLALPGDTIYMKDYILYIKPAGEKLFLTEFELTGRPYNIHIYSVPAEWDNIGVSGNMSEMTLQKDEYFVLADNRVEGTDSRVWGTISSSRLKGKVLMEYFPLNKIRIF